MKQFTETLNALNDRLDLPQPARSRVLLEIAADLRDMYDYYRSQGVPPQDARQKAVEHCDLSDEALAELVRLHSSAWRRFMDRLGEQAQTRWERCLLVLMLVFIVVIAGRTAVSVDVFALAHVSVWVAVSITAVATWFAGFKAFVAFVKQDHDVRRLRWGLPALLVAAGADLVVGAYGGCMGMYEAARRSAEDPNGIWLYTIQWLVEGASLQLVCLSASVLVALMWYLIVNKVTRIERAEATELLG
jgi:hypothetical protein